MPRPDAADYPAVDLRDEVDECWKTINGCARAACDAPDPETRSAAFKEAAAEFRVLLEFPERDDDHRALRLPDLGAAREVADALYHPMWEVTPKSDFAADVCFETLTRAADAAARHLRHGNDDAAAAMHAAVRDLIPEMTQCDERTYADFRPGRIAEYQLRRAMQNYGGLHYQ